MARRVSACIRGAAALQYTFNKAALSGMLSGIFLKVSDGRIPPAAEKSTQIHLGLVLLEMSE
ncbi:MAG: hypothetical protein HZA16_09625 [Nitrospirae bacterium]|nr:hypothetical protein [Nitrospirota bacterium]